MDRPLTMNERRPCGSAGRWLQDYLQVTEIAYLRGGRKKLFDAKAMEALSRPSRGEQRARTPSVQLPACQGRV